MKAGHVKALKSYRSRAKIISRLQGVLRPVLPHGLDVVVCGVDVSNNLVLQVATPAALPSLRALQPVLLSAARTVCYEVTAVSLKVRPSVNLPLSPYQDYCAYMQRCESRTMSVAARQHLNHLVKRCKASPLKSSLEKLLRRYLCD